MNKKIKRILIWTSSIIALGIVGYIGFVSYVMYSMFSGCGMDDGPFKAVLIDPIVISETAKEFDLSNNGKLILENRTDSLSPVLILIEDGKIKWTLDTDTRNTIEYKSTRIWGISNVAISKNNDPIELNFTAHWTYGAEAGSMKIDRDDGDNSFCLSW